MRSLASFVMKGRVQAVLVVILVAGLSMILPPLSLLCGGAVALVTLRLGMQQGITVSLLAALVMSAISMVATGTPIPGFMYVVGLCLPVIVLGHMLRQTVSLGYTAGIACGMGMLAVLAGFLMVPDMASAWKEFLMKLSSELAAETGQPILLGTDQMTQEEAIGKLSRVLTGLLAAGMALNVLFSLMLGRWWQAVLYNPGGFRQEFNQLRMPAFMAYIGLACLVLSLFAGESLGLLIGNLIIVLAFFYLLQAIAICHAVVADRGMHTGWLVGLYVLMLIAPQFMLLLILIGLVDSKIDFRGLLSPEPPAKGPDEQDGGN